MTFVFAGRREEAEEECVKRGGICKAKKVCVRPDKIKQDEKLMVKGVGE